jgi:hypothetical protein
MIVAFLISVAAAGAGELRPGVCCADAITTGATSAKPSSLRVIGVCMVFTPG